MGVAWRPLLDWEQRSKPLPIHKHPTNGNTGSIRLRPLLNSTLFYSHFIFIGLQTRGRVKRRSWINPSEMLKLADAIIASIDVQLSEKAENERALAHANAENARLTTHFPPLKWT